MTSLTLLNILETSPSDWTYISEGGSSIVFSYVGPTNPQFNRTALRLRKIANDTEQPDTTTDAEEQDDPTIIFQHQIIQRLVNPEYLPRLESVRVDAKWLGDLAKACEERRPLERRAKDRINLRKQKAVLATDLVGGKGWAVEIKPKWGFLPLTTHLSPATLATKSNTCRFCMHSHLKSTEGEDVSLGYCPLDLYSGDEGRVKKALHTLWDAWIGSSGSVNNFRVFVEGQMLKPSSLPSSLMPLAQQVLPADIQSPNLDNIRDCVVSSLLPLLLDTPVLKVLSQHQRDLDTLDVEGLATLWTQAHTPLGAAAVTKLPALGDGLSQPTTEELSSFLDVYLQKHADMDHDHPDTANLTYYCLAYLLSATFKDCSIILRMAPASDRDTVKDTITVIDLDVKSVDRLSKWHKLDRKIVDVYTGISKPTICVDQGAK